MSSCVPEGVRSHHTWLSGGCECLAQVFCVLQGRGGWENWGEGGSFGGMLAPVRQEGLREAQTLQGHRGGTRMAQILCQRPPAQGKASPVQVQFGKEFATASGRAERQGHPVRREQPALCRNPGGGLWGDVHTY